MNELERLEAAIAAQEQLRGSVPDDVIDVAVAALRHHAMLAAPSRPKQRKLITVLFADVNGSTTLGEGVDPEELSDLFDSLCDISTPSSNATAGESTSTSAMP